MCLVTSKDSYFSPSHIVSHTYTHTAKKFKYNNFSITCQIEFTGWLGFSCVNLTGCLLFCLHNDSLCSSPIFVFCSSDVATSNTSKSNCWINTSTRRKIYTLQLCWGVGDFIKYKLTRRIWEIKVRATLLKWMTKKWADFCCVHF